MTWIVMTASAHMPSSCKGRYRKIALVKIAEDYAAKGFMPPRIDERIKGVEQIKQRGNHHLGTTARCAYARALEEAKQEAAELNAKESA